MKIVLFDSSDASWGALLLAVFALGLMIWCLWEANSASADAKRSEEKAMKAADRASTNVKIEGVSKYSSANTQWEAAERLSQIRVLQQQVHADLEQVKLIEDRVLTIEERMRREWMQKSGSGLHADDV